MRTLSNGYGFIHDNETKTSLLLDPIGVENWEKSDQSSETARELVNLGQGLALSHDQLKRLSENTKDYVVLE